MTTLDEYRRQCGWSIHLMARQVGIDVNTLRNALAGKTISAQTVGKLADAMSARLKIRLSATDIEDLNVNWYMIARTPSRLSTVTLRRRTRSLLALDGVTVFFRVTSPLSYEVA